jgi:hypothetical protein
MMKLIPFVLVMLMCSTNTLGQTSSFTKKYSGAYNIGRNAVEAYALKQDGTCTWIYGWMSNGKLQTQKKYGSWTAREGYIRISIKGNTGIIVEEYLLKNGKFVNTEDSSRYLIKTN